MLKHIEVQGSDYECGLELGRSMREHIRYRLDDAVPASLAKRLSKDLRTVHAVCEVRHPRFVDSLRGMAEGADADYWRLLLLNAPELTDSQSGCTSIATVRDGRAMLVHNEDGWSGEERRRDCALVTFHQEPVGFTAFVYAGELPGNAYAWNAHGLFYSVDYLEPIESEPSRERIPRFFTARDVLEAAGLEDAVRRIEQSNDASGFHYFVGQGGRIVSIEHACDRVSVKEVAGTEVHTNHYLHPMFAAKAPASRNTRRRHQRAAQLLAQSDDPLRITADRKNAPDAICTARGENGRTLSTVRFSSAERSVTIYRPRTLELEHTFPLAAPAAVAALSQA